jgi:hypothetical protein
VILVAVTVLTKVLATVLAKAAKEGVMEAVLAVGEVTEYRISEPRCLSSG